MTAPRTLRTVPVAALLAFALLAAGCGGTDGPGAAKTDGTVGRENKGIIETTDKAKPGGKIVYGLLSETNGWNPGTNQWSSSGLEVTRAIFDTLSAFDEKSQIHPNLAAGFEHNADYTQWTIKLRPNVKLHNGKPVTADVVVRNQTYLKKSAITGGAYTYTKAFTAKDDLTVVVDLVEPWANYPMTLATQIGVVGDPDWMESNDSLHPIGTGPFSFDQWEIGSKLTVKKNADYWRKDADGVSYPYLDGIEFRPITDGASRSAALRAKDIDIMLTNSGAQITDFQKSDEFQILSDPQGESDETFIILNTQAPPFDDVDARRALAYATDKNAVVEIMTEGFNEPADGPWGPTSPWYTRTDYPQFDQAKARELVEKVKAKHGGTFSFALQGVATPEQQKGQQLLQQQWKEVGIDVELTTLEQTTMIITVVTGKYQAANWAQFGAQHPDLDGVWWSPELASAPPAFTLNFARLKDDEIGAAQKKGRAAADVQGQKDAVAVVQKRLAEDVPYVWLYHTKIGVISSPKLQNVANYTLPDGAKGLDLNEGAHPLFQISLR